MGGTLSRPRCRTIAASLQEAAGHHAASHAPVRRAAPRRARARARNRRAAPRGAANRRASQRRARASPRIAATRRAAPGIAAPRPELPRVAAPRIAAPRSPRRESRRRRRRIGGVLDRQRDLRAQRDVTELRRALEAEATDVDRLARGSWRSPTGFFCGAPAGPRGEHPARVLAQTQKPRRR
jgi:hypothetical protein